MVQEAEDTRARTAHARWSGGSRCPGVLTDLDSLSMTQWVTYVGDSFNEKFSSVRTL